MKVRLLSDLHFEFEKYNFIQPLPFLEDENQSVVVLAGDIFPISLFNEKCFNTFERWIRDVSERHKAVIYVAGNHEHYGNDLNDTIPQLKQALSHLSNVHVLEREDVVVDNVAFIGATLWTDFYGGDPIVRWNCQRRMMDYRQIHNREGAAYHNSDVVPKLLTEDVERISRETKEYLFGQVALRKQQGLRTVVCSHHAPSALSITEEYSNDPCNGGYVNDFSEELLNGEGPDVWCHGHVHSSHDYQLGPTRVLCNAHGIGNENAEVNREEGALYFKYDLVFEV